MKVEQMVYVVTHDVGKFLCHSCRKPTDLVLTRPAWWESEGGWFKMHSDSGEVACGQPVRAEPE